MKIDFSKVENILSESIRKRHIENLSELAIIADLIQAPHQAANPELVDQIAKNFLKDLQTLKEKHAPIYEQLGLTPQEEERFSHLSSTFTSEDWLLIRNIKGRIEELKQALIGREQVNEDIEKEIEQARKEQVYKRFNIRDGWLPLH